MKTQRISWDDFFMKLAFDIATRSTCTRRQVGAVAVLHKRVIATGYNGSVSGNAHCLDIGCMRDHLKIPSGTQHEKCLAVHAEQNIVAQAARYGIPIIGSTVYCTLIPCSICTKMLIQSGVERIIYAEGGYPDTLTETIAFEAGIPIIKLGEDHRVQ